MQFTPSIDCKQTKQLHCILAPTKATISGFTASEMSHQQGTLSFKIPLYSSQYLQQRVREKPSMFSAIFIGLSLTTEPLLECHNHMIPMN